MPEQGRYEKLPRPESIETFIRYLNSNMTVSNIERKGTQVIHVERVNHPPLLVFMTNIYIVGLADVHEILSETSEVGAIVTMSGWNGYTSEAKLFCKEQGIGLFKFNEFLGAVYYDGKEYLEYISPDEREWERRLGKRN